MERKRLKITAKNGGKVLEKKTKKSLEKGEK